MYYMKPTPPEGDLPSLIAKAMFGLQPSHEEVANISTRMLTDFASPKETSEMLMSIMKGALGDHIGNSEDVQKIVLATVTAWWGQRCSLDPRVESAWFQRLILKCTKPLSNVALLWDMLC